MLAKVEMGDISHLFKVMQTLSNKVDQHTRWVDNLECE